MIKRILKYTLYHYMVNLFEFPKGYQIVRLATQNDESGIEFVRIWVMMDANYNSDDTQKVEIVAISTGQDFNEDNQKYIGGVEDSWGFIWHFFLREVQS